MMAAKFRTLRPATSPPEFRTPSTCTASSTSSTAPAHTSAAKLWIPFRYTAPYSFSAASVPRPFHLSRHGAHAVPSCINVRLVRLLAAARRTSRLHAPLLAFLQHHRTAVIQRRAGGTSYPGKRYRRPRTLPVISTTSPTFSARILSSPSAASAPLPCPSTEILRRAPSVHQCTDCYSHFVIALIERTCKPPERPAKIATPPTRRVRPNGYSGDFHRSAMPSRRSPSHRPPADSPLP